MDINTAFPSKYLKAADLKGRTVRVKISHVTTEEVGGDMLPVIYFVGAAKGIVLNKTNANSIAAGYGPETDRWGQAELEVFPSTTDYQGRIVDCVRVRPVVADAVQPAAPSGFDVAPNQASSPPVLSDLDDEIPF